MEIVYRVENYQCEKCGTVVSETDNYCKSCGNELQNTILYKKSSITTRNTIV